MGTVYRCVGIRNVDFKGSDGNQVTGVNLFLTYKDKNITGVGTEKVFLASSRFAQLSFIPSVDTDCELIFNKYGKVADIAPV